MSRLTNRAAVEMLTKYHIVNVKDEKLERSQFTIRLYCMYEEQGNKTQKQLLIFHWKTQPCVSVHCFSIFPKSRYHPADQTAVTPIVTANQH